MTVAVCLVTAGMTREVGGGILISRIAEKLLDIIRTEKVVAGKCEIVHKIIKIL